MSTFDHNFLQIKQLLTNLKVMKKKTKLLSQVLCILLAIGIISYFQACDDMSTTPQSSMVIKNIEGPQNMVCGGFNWVVQFILKIKSPKGGYFVQEIKIKRTINEECPTEYDDIDITYYEAWQVNAGKTITTYAEGGDVKDDTYFMSSMPQSEGNTDYTGKVKFFENLILPADFKANNPKTYAGILPSTKTKPAFWNATNALDHDLDSDWDCCGDSSHTLITTPDFGKIAKQPKTPIGGKFIEQVETVKAWTDTSGYSENDNYALMESAAQIVAMTDTEIITGVNEYSEYYDGYIPEMSKLHLVLRYVYDVPDEVAIDDAFTYGGWIRPVEEVSGSTYNMMWPLGFDEFNMPVVAHPFMGYMGAEYDAPGELAYFMENFTKREF